MVSEELKQTLASMGIKHSDYSDVNASMNNLNNLLEVKKEIKVAEKDPGRTAAEVQRDLLGKARPTAAERV